jgi:hypothetical protein
MSIKLNPKTDPAQPVVYQIRLHGQLDPKWEDWFGGLIITLEDCDETLLTGPVVDQAALHGLLKKVRDLGLPLISVNPVQSDEMHPSRSKKEKSLNTIKKSTDMRDAKIVLSTLWIFAVLNYLYADVFTLFFNPGAQETTLAMPAGAVMGFAILMETAIAMVLLSRVLKYGVNRWANIVAGIIHTALVVWAHTSGTPPEPVAVFFAIIEIACTLFVVWYAWKWTDPEGQPQS